MKTTETMRKPLTEAKYLNVDNTDRYRPIIRLFYLQYEKLNYWLYPEEIFEELKEDPYFADYTVEQCNNDLASLAAWGNLLTRQDTRKAATIEEFKNKQYQYQLSETTVEIERMVLRVENLSIETSSLEPSLLERIRISLRKITEVNGQEPEQIYLWWNDLNNDFVRLNQNYKDYMRELSSAKAEEMMQTRQFLLFKDRLIEYLRTFVKSLQVNVSGIENCLREIPEEAISSVLEKIVAYELSIPRIDVQPDEEAVSDKVRGRWESLSEWFLGKEGRDGRERKESEAVRVFDMTNEIIRKITRYAARISEQSNRGANRREEYYKLAQMFSECADIYEAHRLAALVFGIEKPLHLKGLPARKTESINSGVFEEDPYCVTLRPRVRNFHEKTSRSEITDRSREKAQMQRDIIRQMQEEQQLLKSYICDGCLDFAALPEITPHVRDVFLLWLSRALENRNCRGKTEDGIIYTLENPDTKETCILKAPDGTFEMPAYRIRFEENN